MSYVINSDGEWVEPPMTSKEIRTYIRSVYYGDTPHQLAMSVFKTKLVDNIYDKLCNG